jgi:soluble lytic murein transglycosylase
MLRKLKLKQLALVPLLLLSGSGWADRLDRQREQYLEAEAALKNGDDAEYRELKAALTDYPLYPYLEYQELKRSLDSASPEQVRKFLDRYKGQPVATRLRTSWLHHLGQGRQWDNFLSFYTPQSSVTLQCYNVRARLQKGDRQAALKDALRLWLVGHSQPDACDPAFKQLYESDMIGSDLIWQRIRLAFAEQKSSLAGYLAKRLSAQDRNWVKRWQDAHRRPTAAIKADWAQQDTLLVREILVHALQRLARHKPDQAWKHWQALSTTHSFSATQRGDVLKRIALSGALDRKPDAAEWMASVPEQAMDSDIRQWRVRVALLSDNWKDALRWLDRLTPEEAGLDNWRYWRARALHETGALGDAHTEYTRLSNERTYYAFLASDYLQRPYRMNDERTPVDAQALEALQQQPDIRRAHELFRLGERLDGRREWFYATRNMSRDELKLAAVLAHRWGWHDRAIISATQANHWSDLNLRFPLPHRESILANARRYEVDPGLIYGVIRQESIFMEDAVSSVGALGLMQLMPATGKQTARALNIRYRSNQALLHSDQNIQLGSAYLNKLMTRFNGSPVLAAAAYNAGPHRVDRWLPTEDDMDATLWAELIPFRETRKYVRRVLAYATIFDWRLEQPVTRLSARLPKVKQRY